MITMQFRILLVEDNRAYARLIREFLKEAGNGRFVLDYAERLSAGLEMMAERRPDAVILDLSLPDSQGLATFIQIHERAPHVPVIVLTGLSDEELAVEAVRSGAQDYLVKGEATSGLLVRAVLYGIERQRAEEALAHLAAIVQSSGDAIISTTLDGTISSWNASAERLFGRTAAKAIGQPISILSLPEEPWEPTTFAKKSKSGNGGEYRDTVRVNKNGTRIELSLSVSPIKDSAGRIIGISHIFHDITERKQMEGKLRQLSVHLLNAQDEERRRMARDLHDSTAQSLTAIILNLSLIERSTRMAESARGRLADAISLAKQCSTEIRTMAHLMHPPLLDEMGLAPALRNYVQGLGERSGLRVELEISSDLGRLPKEAEVALFRIVQESLTNVHRHSGCSAAAVQISRVGPLVRLEVADAGRGIPPANGERLMGEGPSNGLGISSMRERLRHLGGQLEIDSSDRGTVVRAYLPLGKQGSIDRSPKVDGRSLEGPKAAPEAA